MLKIISDSLFAVLFRIKEKIVQGMVILANVLEETHSVELARIFVISNSRDLTLSSLLPVN